MKGFGLLRSKVPKFGLSVTATRSTEGSVRRDSDGVEVSGVSAVVTLQFAVGKVPNLNF